MNEKMPVWKDVLLRVLAFPEVHDVVLIHKQGGLTRDDGRILLPVNIYLHPEQPAGGTLGINVQDGLDVDDVPHG